MQSIYNSRGYLRPLRSSKGLQSSYTSNIRRNRNFSVKNNLLKENNDTSISEDEAHHFKELAPSWWDTNNSQRILHLLNLARMDFIQRTINKTINVTNPDTYVPGFNYAEFVPEYISKNIQDELSIEVNKKLEISKKTVLDIGCGGGILTESMARLPYVDRVEGIDLTSDVIKIAKDHLKYDPAIQKKILYSVKPLDKVEGKFDIVTCFEMLEHVEVPSEILRHAWNKVDTNGLLFISTINRDLISWFTTIFMGEYVLKIVPKGTHHLSKYINSAEILEWFKHNEAGRFELLDVKGTMYVPTKGWLEHDYSNIGNYFIALRKIQ
ncbi:hypothetical protein TPHA_0A00670 [Tetrapisispora phaffii CBS 4417]|uniref:Uncharacterized protein n=1 Tax=Tetrapisispora phaffii (strain ATCC 24235 / CBS 4417 / NBRC 1672 / NRRL Y-8282 / UCD 70-5) TaxID=1071381 RepID=G8BMM4_TETPH|nr:hypothetical protein TPHA_0A00670 [Tetrapisispora phaffii CBS 4417]CCE61152.1 hypothetical protein TPHA_0A00670 [Tetrapisispora phaffii CBS 4417]